MQQRIRNLFDLPAFIGPGKHLLMVSGSSVVCFVSVIIFKNIVVPNSHDFEKKNVQF